MANNKIIITGIDTIDKLGIAKKISEKTHLNISPIFTTDNILVPSETSYMYHLNIKTVNLAYKNNSIFYINTKKHISKGVTTDNLEKYDIFVTSIEDYNNISDRCFNNHDFLTIWVDTKHTANIDPDDINDLNMETKYLQERINESPYMYFLDEKIDTIVDIISLYLESDDDNKRKILIDNQ